MASRRTLYIRANNFTQQRFTPPLMKIHHEDDEDRHRNLYAVSRRGFIGSKSSNLLGFRGRSMSTMFTGEVADAAADSSYPVAAVQYMIDGVHSFTGMNWWASIAVSTILAHGMITPIMIHSYKVKRNVQVKLQRIFPMLSKLFAEITDKGHSLGADDFDRIRPQLIMTLKEFVTMQLTPFYGLFSRTFVLISFYYAIGSMAENVPSFKTGGAFLVFTDLTTPDNLYILPTLSALAYWMSAEKDNKKVTDDDMKKFRGSVEGRLFNNLKGFDMASKLLIFPLSMYLSKAHLCCWITSNLYMFIFDKLVKESDQVRA